MAVDLKPPEAPRTATEPVVSGEAKGPGFKLGLLLGMVVAGLLVVLLVLPGLVTDPGDAQQAASDTPLPEPVPEQPGNATEDQLRAEAEKALQKFLHTQAEPDLSDAVIWAPDEWQRALSTANGGDKDFGRGSFATALAAYQDAARQLQDILQRRDQILQQSLDTGWQALADNASGDASVAFERALAIEPDHQQAQSGLEQATVRPRVLEWVTHAQQAYISADPEQAVSDYRSALALDPLYTPAKDALQAIELELRTQAFQSAMGRALQSLDEGDLATVEKALKQAAAIQPGDPVLIDARQRLLSARRQAGLTRLRQQAQRAQSKEDWAGAANSYQQALKIDSQASFARSGLARAQDKLRLHRQLDHYLADTTRLYSDEPLENARRLLAANQEVADSEPLLSGKLQKLQQAVELAAIPVDLLLLSDSLTEVTVYKVGRLGSFAQKRLSLRPGTYTVTGSRQGYRDVLKVIELKPGRADQSLEIHSEEKI